MKQNKEPRNKKDKKCAEQNDTASKKSKSHSSNSANNKIKRHYLKSKALCKVTFKLPKEAVQGAETVTIVGDFNNWNVTQTPMNKLKNGSFTLTLELPCNREFNFRYLVDANRWENDWFADKYVPNDLGDENSVISL
jgi:1,4-alpha-glucan branching enzyme